MKKEAELGRGVIVFIILAVLTGVEYGVAITTQAWGALFVMALLKASLVLQYYMHVGRLTAGEGGH